MKKVTEKQYKEAEAKIEKYLLLVDDNTSIDDPNLIELKRFSDIVESYEVEHYPIETTKLNDEEILITLSKAPGTESILSKPEKAKYLKRINKLIRELDQHPLQIKYKAQELRDLNRK